MITLITVSIVLFIQQTNGFILQEHSVQTCFTSDNRPAVCVDKSLCASGSLGQRQVFTQSNCSEAGQLCCPVGDDDSPDAFIVPRWDWAEWLVNWTYPNHPTVVTVNNQVVNVSHDSTTTTTTGSPAQPNPTAAAPQPSVMSELFYI